MTTVEEQLKEWERKQVEYAQERERSAQAMKAHEARVKAESNKSFRESIPYLVGAVVVAALALNLFSQWAGEQDYKNSVYKCLTTDAEYVLGNNCETIRRNAN